MARKVGDICYPTGKYIKDGEEKTSWTKCGVLLESEKGLRIKLDVIPLGIGESGAWFSVFEERDTTTKTQKAPPAPSQSAPEDDIPF